MNNPYVYIIGSNPLGPVKIGFAINHLRRIKTLQTASPFKIDTIKIWQFPWKDARNLEKAVHQKLQKYCMIGEWFNLSPKKAVKAIYEIIDDTNQCTEWAILGKDFKVNDGFGLKNKDGLMKSALSRKAATAAKLKLIEDDLKKDDHSTRELLDRVGVKSVNSIKNHYGISREQMQIRYKSELKRKERRNAKR